MTPVTFIPNPNLFVNIKPELRALHFRPPPNFPPPPPPPPTQQKQKQQQPATNPHLAFRHSTTPFSVASTALASDDSAYSDSSASTLQYHGEVVKNRSAILLRMDLSKNPPVFLQQGL